MGAYFRNTYELKQEVLRKCGELTNGSSPYEDSAVTYLNRAYQGLLAGGNEFGIQVAEPWVWAKSKTPIKIALTPVIQGAATLTNGSFTGSFSSAPSVSMKGRLVRFSTSADMYKIVSHTAASTSFALDQAFLGDSGTPNYVAYKLDYKCENDVLVVDAYNNKLDFSENGSSELNAVITAGVYSPTTLCAEIKLQMEAVGAETYTVTFDSTTRKFNIAHGGAILELWFLTGTNVATSISELMGFEMLDTSGAVAYSSDIPLSAINRFVMPLTTYRDAYGFSGAARDSGKVFMIDSHTMSRDYPLSQLQQSMPDRFCISEQTPEGLHTLRFNGCPVDEDVRIEIEHIPVYRALQNSTASFPLVPGAHSEYLVDAACYYLLLDKSDNKVEAFKASAAAKLQALVNDNRKGLQLAGVNYGKIIPRPSSQGWRMR